MSYRIDWRTGERIKLPRRKCKFGLWCSIREGDPVICKECLRIHGIKQNNLMDYVFDKGRRKNR